MKKLILKLLACAVTALCALPGVSQAQSAATKYPIVLVHGLYGYGSSLLGDYFYGVPANLKKNGATVLVAVVPAINSNEVRGEALLKQLKQWQATYGYTKFNLIGHSQGSPTSRYVAGVEPSLVASVTSVGGVNGGTPVADTGLAIGYSIIGNPLGSLIQLLTGNNGSSPDTKAALTSLSTAGAAAFSKKFPAGMPTTNCGSGAATVNGINYYSASGTSIFTNVLDVSDAIIGAVSISFLGAASDGLVGRCATHLGTVLKDNYSWNHLDEVNQALGLRGLFSEDPVAFYRTQANRLKNAGL